MKKNKSEEIKYIIIEILKTEIKIFKLKVFLKTNKKIIAVNNDTYDENPLVNDKSGVNRLKYIKLNKPAMIKTKSLLPNEISRW
tara:strand:- start:5360 stop:5611 length:252 start_codon:yes stop_codon:yes gene_type:complete